MLTDFKGIVREVSSAPNLGEALAISVHRIKAVTPVDVRAVYMTGTEADQYVLMASDGSSPASTGQLRIGPQAGLLGLVGERRELITLTDATARPRYRPAPETGEEALSR